MKLCFASFQCDSTLNELFKFKLRGYLDTNGWKKRPQIDIEYYNELYDYIQVEFRD